MGYLGKFFFITLLAFNQVLARPFQKKKKAMLQHVSITIPVRCMYCAAEVHKNNNWLITSAHGFNLIDLETKRQVAQVQRTNLFISTKNDYLFLNGKRPIKNQVLINPQQGELCINEHVVEGPLLLKQDNDLVTLITYEKPQKFTLNVARRLLDEYAIPLCPDDQTGTSKLLELEQLDALEKPAEVKPTLKEQSFIVRVLLDEKKTVIAVTYGGYKQMTVLCYKILNLAR